MDTRTIIPAAIPGKTYTVHISGTGTEKAMSAWTYVVEREARRNAKTIAPKHKVHSC